MHACHPLTSPRHITFSTLSSLLEHSWIPLSSQEKENIKKFSPDVLFSRNPNTLSRTKLSLYKLPSDLDQNKKRSLELVTAMAESRRRNSSSSSFSSLIIKGEIGNDESESREAAGVDSASNGISSLNRFVLTVFVSDYVNIVEHGVTKAGGIMSL